MKRIGPLHEPTPCCVSCRCRLDGDRDSDEDRASSAPEAWYGWPSLDAWQREVAHDHGYCLPCWYGVNLYAAPMPSDN
jgi:hypothetical protein